MSSAARRTTCVRSAAGGTFDDMLAAGAGGSSRRPRERPVVVGGSAVGSGCDHGATEEEVRGVLAGTCQARGSARARFRENGFVSAIRGSSEYKGLRALNREQGVGPHGKSTTDTMHARFVSRSFISRHLVPFHTF